MYLSLSIKENLMQVVLIAAGRGTRLKPLTEDFVDRSGNKRTTSKCMIPVANKPLLQWTADAFRKVSNDIIIVVRKDQSDIIECFPDCRFIYQEEQLGTANAVACAEPLIKDRFILMNADELILGDDIMEFSKLDPYAMATSHSDHPEKFGIVDIKNGIVKNIVEKPNEPASGLVNSGMYFFDRRIFDAIRRTKKSERGEYELTDSMKILISEGVEIRNFTLKHWVPLSYPWNILEANKFLLDRFGSQMGKAEIRPGSYIEEPVAIGDGCVIGPNCFIRKYSSIGKNCKVGNAVEIKNSVIMENSFVSHLSYVGDSIIGRNCNIGAGAVFANLRLDDRNVKMDVNGSRVDSGSRKLGGVVGHDVKFGVNVTVMPGKKIWPCMLIPACSTIYEDVAEQPELKPRSVN
jgi:bifunctional UDP-N-acetylglucosamine pyrophosphorylase/glucosamine-1-phosphate N-acetyltransferase